MIYLKAKDLTDAILINSFPSDFVTSEFDDEFTAKSRFIRKRTSFGTLELLLLEEQRIANSNKVFFNYVNALITALETMMISNSGRAREIADDYLHNIIKIHGNQKSIIERCIAGSDGQESYRKFVAEVKKNVEGNSSDIAEDICALSHEIRLVDYHIGGYRLLADPSSRVTISENQNLKKFMLGLSHLFFESFTKNGVMFSLHGINDYFLCAFEYETFNIAMHSFIENMVKYTRPNSKAFCYTSDTTGELIFEMESIRIEKDEVLKIFERGVSGKNVPGYLRGSGIGLYQLKKALDRSGITVSVRPEHSISADFDEVRYTGNTFRFKFPKYTFA